MPDTGANRGASEPSDAPGAASPSGEDDDPDIIALGFQELDLSASALLYATETTREDAWLAAVLAGLGEKAVEYDLRLEVVRVREKESRGRLGKGFRERKDRINDGLLG